MDEIKPNEDFEGMVKAKGTEQPKPKKESDYKIVRPSSAIKGKNTHRAFSLSLWFEYTQDIFLQRSGLQPAIPEAIIYGDETLSFKADDTKFTCVRLSKDGIYDFFPGQHAIMPVFSFKDKTTKQPAPLYLYDKLKGWYQNPKYFEYLKMWKVRQISTDSLVPDDLKLLIVDKVHCVISDIDLSALTNPDAFIDTNEKQFRDRLANGTLAEGASLADMGDE